MADAPAPASPFPAGDPRSATYNEELGALLHQREIALSSDKASREEAQTGYKYGLSQYNAAEPKALTTEQNLANSQGLLESGINAQRRGGILADYVGKRGNLLTKEQQTEARLSRAEEGSREAYNQGVKSTANKALERYKAEQLALAPNEAPAPPQAPPEPRAGVVNARGEQVPYSPTEAQITGVWGTPAKAAPVRATAPPRVISQRLQPKTVSIRRAAARRHG
jgi:hypothetical protein